jgi:hypothetical protein
MSSKLTHVGRKGPEKQNWLRQRTVTLDEQSIYAVNENAHCRLPLGQPDINQG